MHIFVFIAPSRMYRVKLALLFKLIKVCVVLVRMINIVMLIIISTDYRDNSGEITCAVAQ